MSAVAWIVLVVTDLDDYLVAAQRVALSTVALNTSPAQTDPFGRVMPDVANYVRNRIAGRVQLSATANAVPPELRKQTAYLIIEGMQTRLGLELTEDQVRQIQRAYKDLDIAGTKEFPISEAPDATTPSVQQDSGGIQIANSTTRTASRDNLDGL